MSGVADEQRLSVLFVQLNASTSHVTSLVETRKELKKRSENGGGTVRTWWVQTASMIFFLFDLFSA